ncbi:MAG: LacI family transcriptional regulator [Carboxylicivirga sp.]|jgi:LacI family transcriptional regulator|nr:LacI family transcriptional regulator [Carboxylicivirga sp.]
MGRITLKDIAKELNTTVATVSRALHNSPEIGNEMKERVKAAAKKHNYKPNQTALSLKYQRSYTFGVIFATLQQDYMSTILHGMLLAASKAGYKLIVAESNYNPKKELKLIKEFYEMNVDAILILPSRKLNMYTEKLEAILRDDIPFLVIDKVIDPGKRHLPFITSDDYVGACEGINHLLEQGYRNIAHVRGLESSSVARIRHKAYLDTLEKHHVPVNDDFIIYCNDFTREEGFELAQQLMSGQTKPDAFFCINDIVAIGVQQALINMGYRIPQEIGVLGFSNSDISEVCTPRLSTIHQPAKEMGKKSIKLILSNINKGKDIDNKRIVMKTSLVIRESSNRKLIGR